MTTTARIISLTVLVFFIAVLGITFFQVIAPFLLPLFLAGVLAVLCQPMHRFFVRKTRERTHVAAGLTTLSVLAIFLIPLSLGVFFGTAQLYSLAERTLASSEWQEALETLRQELQMDRLVERLDPYAGGELDPEKLQAKVQSGLQNFAMFLAQRSLGFAASAVGYIISLLTFVIALYYFLADGPGMIQATENLIPLHVDYQRELLDRFESVTRAVVVGTFLAALAQGLVTAVALFFVGFHHFFLILILGTVAAMIPLAGTWVVWVPCVIWLLYEGNWLGAGFVVVVGLIFVALLDNVIRTYVLNNDAKLHPLLAFVSVLGGLQVMGLWGVFIGPIVASCLHALIQIFNAELKELSKARMAQSTQPAGEGNTGSKS